MSYYDFYGVRIFSSVVVVLICCFLGYTSIFLACFLSIERNRSGRKSIPLKCFVAVICLYLNNKSATIKINVFHALSEEYACLKNGVDPDKIPHYVAFHLGLHRLPDCALRVTCRSQA